MRTMLLASFIYMACVDCAAQADGGAGQPADWEAAVSVQFSIENAAGETAEEFAPDSPARFVFRLHNAGDAPARLAFTFPPHRVTVTPAAGGEPVWQAFYGQMFMQVMRVQSIAPDETVEFTAEWDFHYAAEPDRTVPPGEYRVQATFTGFLQPGNQALQPEFETRTLLLRESEAQ